MSRRAWRRTTALILGWLGLTTLLYSGFLPAPVLDDVVWSMAGVGIKPFWLAIAAGELAVATGVLLRYRWARGAAILLGAWLFASGVVGFTAPLTRGLWPDPVALIGVAAGVVVLYAMAARWRARRPPADPDLPERQGAASPR